MKKQRDSMHIARFLSGLPKSLKPVKSQIFVSPILPSLSEVLVDFNKPHYLTLVLPLPPILIHYLLVINLPLPLIRGVIEVVV